MKGESQTRPCLRPRPRAVIHSHHRYWTRPLTVSEVRGIEGQPPAKVLVDPPTGLEEILTLWVETEQHVTPSTGTGNNCRYEVFYSKILFVSFVS